MHVLHFTFALAQLVDHGSGKFVRHIYISGFHRLQLFAVFVCFVQYLSFADGKFVAFPAHIFNQDG